MNVLKRVDQALKLSSELEELMKHPEQPDYLIKLREHKAKMQAHIDPNPCVDLSCLNR
jgi:hypothetical protein